VTGPMVDVNFTVADVDFRRGEVRLLAEIMGRVAEISARAGDVRRCA
jgi:transcription antitermination factor NusG